MTVGQALSQGLLEKLKAAPLVEGQRVLRGHSASEGKSYFAVLFEQTGVVEICGPNPGSVARAVPDDTVWGCID